jgi:hypothetical protein
MMNISAGGLPSKLSPAGLFFEQIIFEEIVFEKINALGVSALREVIGIGGSSCARWRDDRKRVAAL